MARFLGIDLGGTKIAGVLLSDDTVVTEAALPTEAHRGPDEVIGRIALLAQTLCAKAGVDMTDVTALGLGVAAVTDNDRGLIILVANLPGQWQHRPIAAEVGALLGRPVYLLNDAHAFTLAEANLGAGRGVPTVACFTIGTGVGGGFAVEGRVYLGQDGAAGIFGHQTIEPYGLVCGCGNRGCLETLVSGPAIAAQGVRAVLHGADTQIGTLVDNDLNAINPEVIGRAAALGDRVATAILDQVGMYLGIGIANVVTILSPHRVVIGGGVARLGDTLLNPVRAAVKARCFVAPVEKIDMMPATLGIQAGPLGAAIWAAQRAGAR